jgi:hypothetical protein
LTTWKAPDDVLAAFDEDMPGKFKEIGPGDVFVKLLEAVGAAILVGFTIDEEI